MAFPDTIGNAVGKPALVPSLKSAYTKTGAPGVVCMTIDNMIVLEAAV